MRQSCRAEGVSWPHLSGHFRGGVVEPVTGVLGVEDADPAAVGAPEAVQMGEIPADKSQIDCLGEVGNGVGGAEMNIRPQCRLEVKAMTTEEVAPGCAATKM